MIDVKQVVRQLTANAEMIRALVQAVPDEQAHWQPTPEAWSVAQVMEHLYNEERIDFRQHLQEMLHDPPQPWGAFHDDYISMADYSQALDAFLTEREASIAWLKALDSPDWDTTIQATFVDETITLSAGDVLVSWVDHDWAHLRQMIRLLHTWLEKETTPYSTMYGGGSW